MSNNFPPIPVYPKNYDSDYTLFLVYNTAETITTADNYPWSEEISIKSVAPDKEEIWADNGFANIDGELFYYDSVGKNEYGKVNKLKKCVRNLGDKKTKYNKAGSEVRGYVVAQHHNQLVDAILKIENFIGENFTSDKKTLDWRIRNLQSMDVIFDDFTCPDVTFFFSIEENNSSTGILASYNIKINGPYTGFKLDFGDGNSTTSSTNGTHRYAPNAKIDPVVTVATDKCNIVQTPIERSESIEPKIQEEENILEIKIPELPEIPPVVIPTISLPSLTIQPPPLVTPCINFGPLGNINVPSVITFDPPIDIPSVITFVDIPVIPSVINFGPFPDLPVIEFGPFPDLPVIEFGDFPNFPTLIEFGDFPNFPTLINFGEAPNIPTLINFGPAPNIPTLINFGPAPNIPTIINFGPAPSIPDIIYFGPVPTIPSIIYFGPAPTIPSIIYFGPAPTIPSIINFGPAPIIPSIINFGPEPNLPDIINFGPDPIIPDIIYFGPDPNLPDIIYFGPDPNLPDIIYFGPDPNIPSIINFGLTPNIPDVQFGSPPEVTVNWGTPPSCSCTVSVSCPSSTPFASRFGAVDYNDPSIEMNMGDIGIPSIIKVLAPEIPDIRIIHDIPAIIRVEPLNVPKSITIDASDIPKQIKLINENVPSEIKLISDNIPKSISIDASDIPRSIMLEVSKDFPKSIKLDASDIPDKIQVVGIPKHINLVGEIPSEIKLVMPEKPEIELVYKGAPIDLKIQLDVNRLAGDGEKLTCVAIVPCSQ